MRAISGCFYAITAFSASWNIALGQQVPPNSFPHAWPGQPKGDFSPEWQKYFEVTDALPGIPSAGLPRSFAGNIPVDRPGHPNDTLFFWGFERQGANGTLTAPANPNNTEPWILWIQGGPGSSGMLGLSTENGPIHVLSNGSWVVNPYSWNTLADTIWIDQPVGTGFSTADTKGYVADEDQMAEDFLGFLNNLVKIFPSLATRPLYLTGESYAGTYIPYIAKHLFAQPSGPVNLRKIAIGDGSLGSLATIRDLPVINIIETYPALIGYDQEVFNFFKEQHHLCGFDLNLTYPQNGTFPTLNLTAGLRATLHPPSTDQQSTFTSWRDAFRTEYASRRDSSSLPPLVSSESDRLRRRSEWKRDLSGRANGTLDPWYGCDVFDELRDYALNFTFPWTNGGFDVYDIPDATNPEPPMNAAPFLNDPRTRAALHAPTSKNWSSSFNYPFGSVYNKSIGNEHGDPSVEPVAFLTDLATNATARNVSIVFYSGNDDSQVQHRGTEVVIQNFTFGGVQGFTRKPSTPWFDDDGNFAGIVHQERNLTYLLFVGAGHLVPEWKPAQALVFLREFVLGSNPNGTVDGTSVVGGENATLAGDYLPGGNEIFYGSAATQGTSTVPSATIAAWDSFLATATVTGAANATTSAGTTTGSTSGSSGSTSPSGTPNADISISSRLRLRSHLITVVFVYVGLWLVVF
ncbi:alpha/beta-hydrolase [Trametes coccinea BRFM310]|uniref:Carboxypeptidase n=1 Tax=Trametes coccinea (strain BRFM310) TaxID=1353009 RepID=A0A1Y2IH94_TRAC3|nr:alpha/beta-hydrolase [Trametes coccinea BRFM310]